MGVIVAEKKGELKKIIADAIDDAFIKAHQIIETNSGDITPEQANRLDLSIDAILEIMLEQIKQNNHGI